MNYPALPVRLLQDTPLLRWELHGVLEALEDGEPMLRTVSVPPERGKGEGMSSVVGEVESTVDTERLNPRGLQARVSRAHPTVDFGLSR